MKSNFENEIKNKLSNFEVPYEPKVWSRVRENLDQNKPNKDINYKLMGIISILFISLSTAYFFTSKNKTQNTDIISNNKQTTTDENINIVNESKTQDQDISINAFSNDQNEIIDSKPSFKNEKNNFIENLPEVKQTVIPEEIIIEPIQPIQPNNDNSTINNLENNRKKSLNINHLPTIGNKCLNETLLIKNTNNSKIILSYPNNRKEVIIPAKKSKIVKLSVSGKYKLSIENDDLNQYAKYFWVFKSENINLMIEHENTYKNGIPSLSAFCNKQNNIKWYIDNHLIAENSKEVDIHLYKKGNYQLLIEHENDNGCKSTKSETIKINDDYNLMAVNAFFPLDFNDKLNSFIPFALTQRSVKFTFIVIDPVDGSIIFESNDKLRAWNGIDPRNNQIVPINSNWVWKVYIENPEIGESATYQGIVVRL